MKFYDVNGDGSLSYEEFIKVLREPLSERRLKVVQKAFASINGEQTDRVALADAVNAFNVTSSKEFQKGTKTAEQVLSDFVTYFESGEISAEDFENYYADLSMTIVHDQDFISIVEGAWSIHEDEDAGVFKQQI